MTNIVNYSTLLTHTGIGNISHQQAMKKASLEYEKYKEQNKNELSKVEKDFITSFENRTKKLKHK